MTDPTKLDACGTTGGKVTVEERSTPSLPALARLQARTAPTEETHKGGGS